MMGMSHTAGLYRVCALLGSFLLGACEEASAQQVFTSTGLRANGTRYGEFYRSGWTYHRPGFSMQFGGGGGVPFGGVAGNPGFTSGFGFGGFQGNFSAGQFSSSSSTSISTGLTTTNGYPGSMFVGTVRPFVIGVQPVVGVGAVAYAPITAWSGFPLSGWQQPLPNYGPANTVAGRVARGELVLNQGRIVQNDAGQLDLPPAPIEFLNTTSEDVATPAPKPSQPTSAELVAKGDAALAEGKKALARVYFQLAAARLQDPDSNIAAERLHDLKSMP